MARLERRIAQRTQERFRFYLVSLVFTLLAAAVQTAKFGSSSVADSFELMGWLSLLLSGVAGLWSLEYYPLFYSGKARIEDHKEELESAADFHAASAIANEFDATTAKVKALQDFTGKRYSAHRGLFVIGLLLLLTSRAYLPAKHLYMVLILGGPT